MEVGAQFGEIDGRVLGGMQFAGAALRAEFVKIDGRLMGARTDSCLLCHHDADRTIMMLLNPVGLRRDVSWHLDGASHATRLLESFRCRAIVRVMYRHDSVNIIMMMLSFIARSTGCVTMTLSASPWCCSHHLDTVRIIMMLSN